MVFIHRKKQKQLTVKRGEHNHGGLRKTKQLGFLKSLSVTASRFQKRNLESYFVKTVFQRNDWIYGKVQ